jgi:hypothetical protein
LPTKLRITGVFEIPDGCGSRGEAMFRLGVRLRQMADSTYRGPKDWEGEITWDGEQQESAASTSKQPV